MSRTTFGRIVIGMSLCVAIDSSATHAQVVQLPTVSSFGVSTTVSVPDHGSIFLGGSTVGRTGSVGRGFAVPGGHPLLWGNLQNGARSISRSRGTATIIDLREWDKAVLAEARRRKSRTGSTPNAVDCRAAAISRHVATSPHGRESGQLGPRDGSTALRATSSTRPRVGGWKQDSNDDFSQLTYHQLMSRGRAAMAARQYRLAKKYFQSAAGD
jgi:hypothetical protein